MIVTAEFSGIKRSIIAHLNKSITTINVAVAWLTDEDIIRTLSHRKEMGIDVKIAISNSIENFRNIKKFQSFLRLKGDLFVATNPFLHHKFCIIDDSMIINGSYNWSYSAIRNDENIVIINLDKETPGDSELLRHFNIKYQNLCNSCLKIPDYNTLKTFAATAVDVNYVLAKIDEDEIKLRQQFENDVKVSLDKSIEANIPFNYSRLLDRMKKDGGGVEFVKRIIYDEMNTGEMKSGFRKLEQVIPHRVDLSLEYLVCKPVYQTLFTKNEIEFCIKLMTKYNIDHFQ